MTIIMGKKTRVTFNYYVHQVFPVSKFGLVKGERVFPVRTSTNRTKLKTRYKTQRTDVRCRTLCDGLSSDRVNSHGQ